MFKVSTKLNTNVFSGLQLKYIHAYSFDSHVPQVFHTELQCIAQRSCYPKKEPWFKVANLKSMGGRSFLSFAKYTRFKDGKVWYQRCYYFDANCTLKINSINIKLWFMCQNAFDIQFSSQTSLSKQIYFSLWNFPHLLSGNDKIPKRSMACLYEDLPELKIFKSWECKD